MADLQEALANPFSPEKAYFTFRENMTTATRLREEIQQGQEAGSASTRELLLKAVEALGRLTDNTILLRVISGALEARDG